MDHDLSRPTRGFRLTPAAARAVRRHGLRPDDPVRVIATSIDSDQDRLGRHRFVAELRGIRVRAVVSATDPCLIVAVELLARRHAVDSPSTRST